MLQKFCLRALHQCEVFFVEVFRIVMDGHVVSFDFERKIVRKGQLVHKLQT